MSIYTHISLTFHHYLLPARYTGHLPICLSPTPALLYSILHWCWDSENYISWASCQLISCQVLPSGDTCRGSKGRRKKRRFLPLAPQMKQLLAVAAQQQGWALLEVSSTFLEVLLLSTWTSQDDLDPFQQHHQQHSSRFETHRTQILRVFLSPFIFLRIKN